MHKNRLFLGLCAGLFAVAGCGQEPGGGNGRGAQSVDPACVLPAALSQVHAISGDGTDHGMMDFESEWLPKVVACENGDAPYSALLAQAIASRTYAVTMLTTEHHTELNSAAGDGAYDPGCFDKHPSNRANIIQAVKETEGRVLAYDNNGNCPFVVYGNYVAGAVPDPNTCQPDFLTAATAQVPSILAGLIGDAGLAGTLFQTISNIFKTAAAVIDAVSNWIGGAVDNVQKILGTAKQEHKKLPSLTGTSFPDFFSLPGTSSSGTDNSSEQYVTYNEGKKASDADFQITPQPMNTANKYNHGCMSQYGANCLAQRQLNGKQLYGCDQILRFYYGEDIQIANLEDGQIYNTCTGAATTDRKPTGVVAAIQCIGGKTAADCTDNADPAPTTSGSTTNTGNNNSGTGNNNSGTGNNNSGTGNNSTGTGNQTTDPNCPGVTDLGGTCLVDPNTIDGTTGKAVTGACTVGVRQCQNGQIVCVQTLHAGQQQETCDGVDNDCDGAVDNNVTEVGQSCDLNPTYVHGECLAKGGTKICESGRLYCQPKLMPGSQTEACDGKDNDCDGQIDNGNPGGGKACALTDGTQGLTACIPPDSQTAATSTAATASNPLVCLPQQQAQEYQQNTDNTTSSSSSIVDGVVLEGKGCAVSRSGAPSSSALLTFALLAIAGACSRRRLIATRRNPRA